MITRATDTTSSAGGEPGRAGAGDASFLAAPGAPVPDDVRGVVQRALEAVTRAGTTSRVAVTEALDGAARSLSRRVVAEAASPGRVALADERRLRTALADTSSVPSVGSATTAAVALKLAGRFRPLGFLARRTPALLVATAVPAVVASVGRGADEVGMVASHLVHRARAEGVEPDLDRVRRAAVQIASGHPVDPDVEPSHGAVALRWLRRAVRAALPFASGVVSADPVALAEAAAAVDATRLGPR